MRDAFVVVGDDEIPLSQFVKFTRDDEWDNDPTGHLAGGGTVSVTNEALRAAQRDAAPVVPASPGWHALERLDVNGVFDVEKHTVIAWRIWDGMAHPITVDSHLEAIAVLTPDRHVEDFFGIRHNSLAEYLDWMRDDIKWDEVVLSQQP